MSKRRHDNGERDVDDKYKLSPPFCFGSRSYFWDVSFFVTFYMYDTVIINDISQNCFDLFYMYDNVIFNCSLI